jgi:hypothetical protein
VETATELSTSEAADRPEWVEAAPHKVDGAYRVAIKVGPYKTRIECDRELPDKLREAVDEYVTTYLGRRAYGRLFFPRGSIDRMLVKEEWEEPTQVLITPKEKPPEYVPMVTLHVLLEFDREVNALIQQQWDRMIVEERLVGVGGLAAVVLLLLSGVYGYLKIDLATKGKYRGWLRIAAAALILLLIVAGLAMAVDFDIVQDPF